MIDLEYPRYDSALLDQLFTNILNDDIVHLDAGYPHNPAAPFPDTLAADCYRLCWQSLDRRVDIPAFRKLIWTILISGGTDDPEQRLAFKYARARFKHLRFAFANLDVRHRYPWSLNFVTTLMGHMQDAFKNRQARRTRIIGAILWLVLQFPFYTLIRFKMKRFRPADQKSLQKYFRTENEKMKNFLQNTSVTGQKIHNIRKIISRRVAFNDTWRVLHPDQNADAVSRYLATINGLMGNLHDILIEKRFAGHLDYRYEPCVISYDIIERLQILINEFDRVDICN